MSSRDVQEPDKGDWRVLPVALTIDNKDTRRKPRMGMCGLMARVGADIAAEPVLVLRPGL